VSERVGAIVARGDAELGFQQVSELIHFKELDFVGTLPQEVQQTIFFSAGLVAGSTQADAARHLVRFLSSPAVAEIVRDRAPSRGRLHGRKGEIGHAARPRARIHAVRRSAQPTAFQTSRVAGIEK
jgi:hypothetical protein